jgi:arylsulfatase A
MSPRLAILFLLVSLGLFLPACQSSAPDEPSSPNVVILLADDLGYGDLNSYGGIPQTPHLDRLAEQGLTFTDFYAPAPNCSPSRAGLLTGRNPNRVGLYSYRRPTHTMHLPGEEVTLAELLKKQGYQTALFGKWHLSDLRAPHAPTDQPSPGDQGFDYWLATENNASPSHHNPGNFVRNGTPADTLRGYSSHILAREATQWLAQQRESGRPFFLYVPFHEVHKTIASPDSLTAQYAQSPDPEYQANVEQLDAAVGKILDHLRSSGRYRNTIILFSSDNGSYRYGSNGRLRGFKGETFEGGVRVPAILEWPSKIEEPRTVETPAGLIDFFPTLADITGASVSSTRTLDGTSLLPLIQEQEFTRSTPLFWFFYRARPEAGMRSGQYVLNAYARDTVPRNHPFTDRAQSFVQSARLRDFKLYNLEEDPLQKRDLSSSRPRLLDSLKTEAKALFRDVQAEGPRWPDLPAYDPAHARPKTEYMRNQERRWDMEK